MVKIEKEGYIDFFVELEKFKKEYVILQKKYSLPKFEELAEDFDIEKAVYRETSFVLRDIRRLIAERFGGYLSLFETLVNPSAPSVFIFSILKNLSSEETKDIKETYDTLAKIQIRMAKIDVIYSEKKEAEFIKNSYKEWEELKPKIFKLFEKIEEKMNNSEEKEKRGYLG